MRDVIQDSASEYDIMIVGGGPAGLSTWLHLHKYDPDLASKTVLIEKAKYPRDKLCGGALGEYTETILKQLKIDITIPSIQIHRVKCRVGDEVFCRKKHNYFKIIRRLEFDHALAQTAIARGLRLHENETFIEMKTQKDGVVVKTSRQKYRTRVLIGADGSTSEVRRKMNLPKKPRFATAIEIFTTVNPQYDKELTTNTVSFDFSWVTAGLQGYVWHFPCIVNNNPSMNHGIGNFRFFPDKPRADTKKIFAHTLEERNIMYNPKSWCRAPIHWFSEGDKISQPHVLLTGDAAGIDPALGGGIQLALWYGELAAATVVDAFNEDDFSFKNYRKRFFTHSVGKYINYMTKLANRIYKGDVTETLEGVREMFSK